MDSADTRRLMQCAEELQSLLTQERLSGASLLVFANKQDLKGALTAEQIARLLGLQNIELRHWCIVACSAVTGDGLIQGIDWVVNDVSSRIFMME